MLWLWSERRERLRERQERLRLQQVIEGFLPVLESTRRTMRNVNRIVGGDLVVGDDEGG